MRAQEEAAASEAHPGGEGRICTLGTTCPAWQGTPALRYLDPPQSPSYWQVRGKTRQLGGGCQLPAHPLLPTWEQ